MALNTTAEYLVRKLSRHLADVRRNVETPDQFLTVITNVIEDEDFDEEYFPSEAATDELLISIFIEAIVMLTNALPTVSAVKFGKFLTKFAQLFNCCGSYETTYKCVQEYSEALASALHTLLTSKEYAREAISVCFSIAENTHEDPEYGEAWSDRYLERYGLTSAISLISRNAENFWDKNTQADAQIFEWSSESESE